MTTNPNGLKYILDSLKRAADNSECWPVYPAESGLILAEIDRWSGEVDRERAAVVAWLRSQAESTNYRPRTCPLADAIERGEHRRGEQE